MKFSHCVYLYFSVVIDIAKLNADQGFGFNNKYLSKGSETGSQDYKKDIFDSPYFDYRRTHSRVSILHSWKKIREINYESWKESYWHVFTENNWSLEIAFHKKNSYYIKIEWFYGTLREINNEQFRAPKTANLTILEHLNLDFFSFE